jgi:hypothetical protein
MSLENSIITLVKNQIGYASKTNTRYSSNHQQNGADVSIGEF